ncbi:MAG: molybdopterin-dependent oxidoreductase [Novosphingobium sp.]|nr:molybdopterin-dependent oxidoreductase [Novosphingobium sp.]MCP5401226.1 molybdopterin-dependent oxidoreductase [Novosphingobium sp.]
MANTEKKSFCRICGSGCGIIVELDGQQVVKVRADRDHPVSQGYTCPKGRSLPGDHHREDRIDVPMIRENGELRPTSWEHVLDDLAAKLSGIIEDGGPRGVGTFIGGGGFLDASGFLSHLSFLGTVKTPSAYSDMTIDSVAKTVAAEMVTGISGLEPRADLKRTKLVIFMGTNPVISHTRTINMHAPTAAMRDMRAHGAELWTIDPRNTETAQRSNGHIAPRPGTDYAILGYLIRELLIDGADFEYIERHAQGADGLRAAVERFTPERTAAVCGIEQQELAALLAAVRKAGRLSVETGTGITMQRAGNVTQWLSLALMIVTGSLDREGGSWVNPGLINRKDLKDFPAAPEAGWNRPGPESRPELRGTAGDYPCAAIPDEIAARFLRAMLVFGGNLETCLPETDRTYEALKQLEVLAVLDVRHTRTTDIATHVLPTKDQLERSDISFVTDSSFPIMVSQYTPAMVEPLGERKAFWWIVGQLGKRMGMDFFPGLDVDTATDDTVIEYILRSSDVDFETLRSQRLAFGEPVIGWVQRFVDEKIGGWRMAPQQLADQLRDLEAREDADEAEALILIPRRQKYHENSKLLEVRDKPYVFMTSRDARQAGIEEGALVEVRSANGTVRRCMKIDDTLRAGCINVPHGWSDELNVNRLTSTTHDVDPITGMLLYSGLEVSVEAV